MTALHGGVLAVIALLAGALVVGDIAARLRIPYIVALLIAALPLEIPHVDEHFAPALLFVFLPALLFEAAWNVDATLLKKHWLPVAVLAVPGVLLTAFFVAFGLATARILPFGPALVLGAILAATDPIAVIATFRRLAVSAELTTVVEGESLFNDGVAIALYSLAVAALAAGHTSIDPLAVGAEAIKEASIGAAIGFAAAVVVGFGSSRMGGTLQHIVGTIVAAYGSYLIADSLHVSGIFAAVVAGIALRALRRRSREETLEIERFWEVMAFIASTLVFALMGIKLDLARIVHEPLLVLVTLLLVTAARILASYAGLPLAGVGSQYKGWHHVVMLSGMRGALSVALALALPDGIPYRTALIDATFGVVAVTLVVQGLAIAPLILRLRLAHAQ